MEVPTSLPIQSYKISFTAHLAAWYTIIISGKLHHLSPLIAKRTQSAGTKSFVVLFMFQDNEQDKTEDCKENTNPYPNEESDVWFF